MKPNSALLYCLAISGVVGVLWAFPAYWYSGRAAASGAAWFGEATHIEGWRFREIPVSKESESILVADRTVNGQFGSDDSARVVRVLSAKRYVEWSNEAGLFVHTPDHCWTSSGWKLLPSNPVYVDCDLHGTTVRCERRVFTIAGHEELVYFGALVGGRLLPYRLDQYLGWAAQNPQGEGAREHLWSRLHDQKLWGVAWDAFLNRTALRGPQHFFRVSTPVWGDDLASADKLLQKFLPLWLVRGDYQRELAAWKAERAKRTGQAAR